MSAVSFLGSMWWLHLRFGACALFAAASPPTPPSLFSYSPKDYVALAGYSSRNTFGNTLPGFHLKDYSRKASLAAAKAGTLNSIASEYSRLQTFHFEMCYHP